MVVYIINALIWTDKWQFLIYNNYRRRSVKWKLRKGVVKAIMIHDNIMMLKMFNDVKINYFDPLIVEMSPESTFLVPSQAEFNI